MLLQRLVGVVQIILNHIYRISVAIGKHVTYKNFTTEELTRQSLRQKADIQLGTSFGTK